MVLQMARKLCFPLKGRLPYWVVRSGKLFLVHLKEWIAKGRWRSVGGLMLFSLTRNPAFFGRTDVLESLDRHLLPKREAHGLHTFAICGLGGIGKTQIVIEFALSRKEKFGAVLWIQADELAKLGESFSRISEQLGLGEGPDILDRIVSRNYVIEWLSAPRKRNSTTIKGEPIPDWDFATWLLIFDNADDISLLRDYWPVGANGSILLTSRDPLAKTELHAGIGVDLGPFTLGDSADLLQKLTGEELGQESRESSLALANSLGGFPLALVQIAALIRRNGMSIREFRDLYEGHLSVEDLAKEFHPRDQYGYTIFSVWTFQNLSPDAKNLLRLLSILDPDAIDESILSPAPSERCITDFPKSKLAYINARIELRQSSLIIRNADKNQLSIHRLVQGAVRHLLLEEERSKTFELAIDLLFCSWPTDAEEFNYDKSKWAASDRAVPHVTQLSRVYDQHSSWAIAPNQKRNFARLLQMTAWLVNLLWIITKTYLNIYQVPN